LRHARPLATAALLVVIGAAFGLWYGLEARRARRVPVRDAAGYVQAALEAEGRDEAAAAFRLYDEGAARFPGDPYMLGSYAAALNNRSYAVRLNRGRLVPVGSTSRRRVADACAALALLEQAEEAHPRLAAPALYKGRLYAAWGFPEDALEEFVAAYARGDRSPELDRSASGVARLQLAPEAPVDQNGSPASR
jgi:hypothetical protein